MSSHSLSERDREVLAFERRWWKYAGTKDSAVRTAFDIGAGEYYQHLNRLIDHPGAHSHDPLLVRRLRRQRAQRQLRRSSARRSEAG